MGASIWNTLPPASEWKPKLIINLGLLCRKRAASGYVHEAVNVTDETSGIDLPFILEMIRAEVASNDLTDTERHIASALYVGLVIGHRKTSFGLPMQAPATENDIEL